MAPSGPSVSFPLFSPCQHQISIQSSILRAPPTPSFDAPVLLPSAMAITCKPLPFPMLSPMPLPWKMSTHPAIFGAAVTQALTSSSFGQCIHPCRWSPSRQSTSWVHRRGLSCLHLLHPLTTPTAGRVDPQVFAYPYPHPCKPVPVRYGYRFGQVRVRVGIFYPRVTQVIH